MLKVLNAALKEPLFHRGSANSHSKTAVTKFTSEQGIAPVERRSQPQGRDDRLLDSRRLSTVRAGLPKSIDSARTRQAFNFNNLQEEPSQLPFGTAVAILMWRYEFEEDKKMAAPAYCFTTLTFSMDEKPEEITIHCNGKITAESAYMFQREVRDNSIPVSRGKGVAAINRIVLDLSNVTHIDNAGLQALLDVWTAGQRKACDVEIVNFGPQAFKRAFLTRLNQAFRKMLALFDGR